MKADGANGSQKLMVVKLSQTRKAKFTAKEVQLLFVFETTPQILWQTILLVISNKYVRQAPQIQTLDRQLLLFFLC